MKGIHPNEQLLQQAGPRLLRRSCTAREGRQAIREAGGWTGKQAEGKALQGAQAWALHTRACQRIQAGMCPLCKPAGTHSQACQWPQPAQADVFWVLLFRFPSNCFPSGPASGTKCQVVLWEGVMERWKDRVYYQSKALEAVRHRRPILFPFAPCGVNYGNTGWDITIIRTKLTIWFWLLSVYCCKVILLEIQLWLKCDTVSKEVR